MFPTTLIGYGRNYGKGGRCPIYTSIPIHDKWVHFPEGYAALYTQPPITLGPLITLLPCPHVHHRVLPPEPTSDSDELDLDSVPPEQSSSPTQHSNPQQQQQRTVFDWPLENGLDVGIYKAILVGQVGQKPLQKTLKSGRTVTMFSLGTGGIRNNRRPLDNEDPREYANRCAVQWHRVSVYPDRLGGIVNKHVVPG
ncbi:hypothetical protein SO802_021076 [Lithocarpus litseifolius]|uniref:Single-stranded DNA-binding protein n=1 Tax=Lithocarpus litseifolius TaxID=425828 RepID=A0AAW2CIW8_9ROSI